MVVAYDGTDFNGFAPQRGQSAIRTVGGVLGQALGKVLRHEVDLTCAGRTDAGVHAWGQVVSFPSEPGSRRVAPAIGVELDARPGSGCALAARRSRP